MGSIYDRLIGRVWKANVLCHTTFVSNDGLVRSGITRRLFSPFINNRGYARITAGLLDGTRVKFSVHRAVAATFIRQPRKGEQVHHKDGGRLNNRVCNLEWVSSKKHAVLRTSFAPKKSKEELKDLEQHIVFLRKSQFSIVDIIAETGAHVEHIRQVCLRRGCWHCRSNLVNPVRR